MMLQICLISGEDRRCIDINNELAFCSNMTWTRAFFPNFMNHGSQEEAAEEIEEYQFGNLIRSRCSEDIRHLVCSFYAPVCPDNHKIILYPCQQWCKKVADACRYIFAGSEIPPILRCDDLPEKQPCFFVGNYTSIFSP